MADDLKMLQAEVASLKARVLVLEGKHGAKAAASSTEVTVGFGSCKGQKVSELSDRDLEWYGACYEENVADPARAQYKSKNRAVLDAIVAEKAKRARG